MPKKLHDELLRRARQKGYKSKRAARYVYGTLRRVMRNERPQSVVKK